MDTLLHPGDSCGEARLLFFCPWEDRGKESPGPDPETGAAAAVRGAQDEARRHGDLRLAVNR